MNGEEINFYKTHLPEIRKLKEESDYEMFNSFLIASNNFGIENLDLVLLGFDDDTEDDTAAYSLTHAFADIYKKTDKIIFFGAFLSNLSLLFPHAINWCRTLFAAWNYNESESLLFIEVLKTKSNEIEKVLLIYDLILNERFADGRQSNGHNIFIPESGMKHIYEKIFYPGFDAYKNKFRFQKPIQEAELVFGVYMSDLTANVDAVINDAIANGRYGVPVIVGRWEFIFKAPTPGQEIKLFHALML